MGPYRDTVFLSVAGVVVFAVLNTLATTDTSLFLSAVVTVAVVDMAHIYITLMRIWRECHIRPRWFMAVFVGLFTFIAAAHYLRVPYLLSFVLYYAFIHFLRQNYGIHRWYLRRSNERKDAVLDWLLFGLTVTPFVAMHFRTQFAGVGFVDNERNELFLLPWRAGFEAMLWVIGAVIVAWASYEVWLWKRGVRDVGRIIFFASNALLYNAAFLWAHNGAVIVFALLTMHALQYIALTGHFGMQRYGMSVRTVWWVVCGALMLAVVDVGARAIFGVDFARIMASFTLGSSLLLALLLLPSLSHYTIDMWIWRRSWLAHVPEAKLRSTGA